LPRPEKCSACPSQPIGDGFIRIISNGCNNFIATFKKNFNVHQNRKLRNSIFPTKKVVILKKFEKYFVTVFLLGFNKVMKPKIGNIKSLYTYLDGTNESHSQQLKQINYDDPYIVACLETININRSILTKKTIVNELTLYGYFSNKIFVQRFNSVVEFMSKTEYYQFCEQVKFDLINIYKPSKFELRLLKTLKDAYIDRHLSIKLKSAPTKEPVLKKSQTTIPKFNFNKRSYLPETCYLCNGKGKGLDSRMCLKCMGRGYLNKH